MTSYFRWYLIFLIFGLVAPLDLPAGGLFKENSDFLELKPSGQYFAGSNCSLRYSPYISQKAFQKIQIGTPLKIIRSWQSEDKNNWFQVQISSIDLLSSSIHVNRGWVKI